jgi:hypothetical protein
MKLRLLQAVTAPVVSRDNFIAQENSLLNLSINEKDRGNEKFTSVLNILHFKRKSRSTPSVT